MDSKEINSSQPKESKINDSLPKEKQILPPDPTSKEDQKKYFTPAQHRRYQRKQAIKNKHITYGPECEKDRIRILENALVSVVEESLALLDKKRPVAKLNELKTKPHIHHSKHSLSKADENKKANLKKEFKQQTESHENKEVLTPKMDSKASDKSREEIQAAREAKKAAKLLSKNKSKSNVAEKSVETKTATKNDTINEKVATKSEKKVAPITNKKVVTSNDKKIEKKPDKIEYVRPKSNQVPAIIVDSQKEKSKDVAKDQRDSRELAKPSTRTKGKTNSDITSLETKISKVSIQEVKDVATVQKQTVITKEKSDILVEKQEKTKSELKAERRAKQEAQRAAKELLQATKPNPASDVKNQGVKTKDKLKPILATAVNIKISQSPEKTKLKLIQSQHKVKLFNHLYGERETAYLAPSIPLNSKEIHPAIVRLGVQYASHIIMGSNARCIALLNALKQVIDDYTLPPNVEFSRGLEAHLTPCMNFLKSCRLPAVSMNNAIKHIKWQLTQLPNAIAEYDAKAKLNEAIDTYVTDQIKVAGQAISIAVCNKISNGDVILTYGCSSLIEKIVTEAAASKNFRVVVVAAHPWNEGREMLRRLTAKDVKCSLIMISALSFVMREINKVILGAGALLANGYVMARAGTAQVAMVANAHNVPVLVCCETHKFSERVQTDSFVYNEIGNPDDLIKCESNQDSPLANWRTYNSLTLLNLTYDVTPPDLVTAVVTELAILPCTSVPVILRIKPSEFGV